MQLPIQSAVALKDGRFIESSPINLEHSIVETGFSKGQLVTTRGAVPLGTGPGVDRGGIWWNGTHYRVMGPDAAALDTALYPDNLHPNNLGYAYLAGAPSGTYANANTYYDALRAVLRSTVLGAGYVP